MHAISIFWLQIGNWHFVERNILKLQNTSEERKWNGRYSLYCNLIQFNYFSIYIKVSIRIKQCTTI
jgi:hypothetical protein